MLGYVGRGYTPSFTANYNGIAKRLAAGEDILIVSGPDDICAPLMDEPEPHCLRESVVQRDKLAVMDVGKLLDMPIDDGAKIQLTATMLDQMRQAFAAGRTRAACLGCEWYDLCSDIAKGGFANTRIQLK